MNNNESQNRPIGVAAGIPDDADLKIYGENMSDTPRSDAMQASGHAHYLSLELARTLERELAVARKGLETELRQNLCELQAQWRETAKVFRKQKDYELGAAVYMECIGELNKILNGDNSPIAKGPDITKEVGK